MVMASCSFLGQSQIVVATATDVTQVLATLGEFFQIHIGVSHAKLHMVEGDGTI